MKKIALKSLIIIVLIFAGCASAPPEFDGSEPDEPEIDESESRAGEIPRAAETPGEIPRAAETPAPDETPDEDYQQSIITLLETFDGILITAELENELTLLYRKVRPLLSGGQIQVQVDKGDPGTNLERSQLRFDSSSSKIIISLHVSILDDLESNPVPALSEFAGRLVFMDDFLQHGEDVVELYQNPLEYYLAQMDGIYLQTIFLRDFARPIYGEEQIGPYENYLLQGLAVDGLSSISLFAWGIDREIIYSMLGLSTQLGEKIVSLEGYVREVLQLGREIRDNLEQSRRLFEESGEVEGVDGEVARRGIYIAATSANTYRSLGSIIFSNALNTVSSEEDYKELEEEILEIQQIYNFLEEFIQDLAVFRKDYQKQYFSDFFLLF